MQLKQDRVRMMFDQQSDDGALDAITGGLATAAAGTDIQFELGFSVTIKGVNTILDVANFDAVRLVVVDPNDIDGGKLMDKSIGSADLNLLTRADWDAGTAQHGIISFSAAETALALGGKPFKDFYLEVGVTTNAVPSKTFRLGFATLRLERNAISATDATPPLGGSLVAAGTPYSGAGAYVLTTTAGLYYTWTKAANDTSLVNGTETLNASGLFQAQGASVTLNGTPSATITAFVRKNPLVTEDRLAAAIAGVMRIVGQPGVLRCDVSPSSTWIMRSGIGDDGMPIQRIDPL